MKMASIHSHEEVNTLEHLLSHPTWIGASTDMHTRTWSWDDGSEWQFQPTNTPFRTVDFESVPPLHLAMVLLNSNHSIVEIPQDENPCSGSGLSCNCEQGKDRKCGNITQGWINFGKGGAKLWVLCFAVDIAEAELCQHMRSTGGTIFSPATRSCYAKKPPERRDRRALSSLRPLRAAVID